MAESSVSEGADGRKVKLAPDVEKCYICLSPFEDQPVASLDSCQHVFCLQCVLQWSQTANTCPVDRSSFAFLLQRASPGGDVQKRIRVRNKKNDDDDDVNDHVICEECGRSDRRQQLLLCMHCDSGYHMNCLTPSLSVAPDTDWICPECVNTPQQTEISVQEEEISDGELSDLLAEVDGAAAGSSRLRPSTLNRPSSSAERRHSARIQSRAGGGPSPSGRRRPETAWHVPKHLIKASRPTDSSAAAQSDTSNTSVTAKPRKRRKRAS